MAFLWTLLALALLLALARLGLITHTLTLNWSSGGGTNLLGSQGQSATAENNLSFTVAGGVTNQAEALAFVRVNVLSVYMKSDQDVTLKTNSSGSPQDTITLKAGIPVLWYTNCGVAVSALFAGDVTNSFWTNAGSTTANVEVRVLKTA